MADAGDGPDAMTRLLPWWSKLVHRIVVAEAVAQEDGDERKTRRDALGSGMRTSTCGSRRWLR